MARGSKRSKVQFSDVNSNKSDTKDAPESPTGSEVGTGSRSRTKSTGARAGGSSRPGAVTIEEIDDEGDAVRTRDDERADALPRLAHSVADTTYAAAVPESAAEAIGAASAPSEERQQQEQQLQPPVQEAAAAHDDYAGMMSAAMGILPEAPRGSRDGGAAEPHMDAIAREDEAIRRAEEEMQVRQQQMKEQALAIMRRKQEATKQREAATRMQAAALRDNSMSSRPAAAAESPSTVFPAAPSAAAAQDGGLAYRAASPTSYRSLSALSRQLQASAGGATESGGPARGSHAYAAWQNTAWGGDSNPGGGVGLPRAPAGPSGEGPSVRARANSTLNTGATALPSVDAMRAMFTSGVASAEEEYARVRAEATELERLIEERRRAAEAQQRQVEANMRQVASLRKEAELLRSLYEMRRPEQEDIEWTTPEMLRQSPPPMAMASAGAPSADEDLSAYLWLRSPFNLTRAL